MIYSGIYLVNFVSENKAVHTNSSIVLYDSHCNFCSAIVRYFKQKDNTNSILWLANDSKKGTTIIKELKLEKQIEKFRIREVKELEKLERISLKEKREDYSSLQDRIEKLKAKYRIIRDQKIRERVEALGVKIQEDDDRETLLRKEK